MLRPIDLPRGVAQLFSLGDRYAVTIIENTNRRPDRVVPVGDPNRVEKEFMDNNLSCKSPITLKKGDTYFVVDDVFFSYFGGF